MDLLMLLAILGGIYVILAFWHFPVRARHCLVYTALYVPLLLVLRLRMGIFGDLHLADMGNFWWCLGILWLSHFIIDTYWPVMMWAKYLRRADQFKHVKRYGPRADGSYTMTAQQFRQFMEHGTVVTGWQDKVVDEITYANDAEAFKAFFNTGIGAILCITMDQLFHLAFLWPVAWLIAN